MSFRDCPGSDINRLTSSESVSLLMNSSLSSSPPAKGDPRRGRCDGLSPEIYNLFSLKCSDGFEPEDSVRDDNRRFFPIFHKFNSFRAFDNCSREKVGRLLITTTLLITIRNFRFRKNAPRIATAFILRNLN